MKTIYLVVRHSINDMTGLMIDTDAFTNEDEAREYYEDLVTKLQCDYDGVYDICDCDNDICEFYNEGRYLEEHDGVELRKIEAM